MFEDARRNFGEGLTDSPLRHVRVVDFTQALSGPYATLLLADLGADVVKVEAPRQGDDSRHWGPPYLGADATYFVSVNRNKRSVAADLKTESGRNLAKELIGQADVVIENWKPGTADRLGVGFADAVERNKAIIYCSITGFGRDGDARVGYDQIVQGTAGAMSITGPEDAPTKWGVPAADICAGMYAVTIICAALHRRSRAPEVPQLLEVSMEDAVIAMLTHHAARQLNGTTDVTSEWNDHATIAPYGMFKAADRHINICVGNDTQFARLCMVLELPQVLDDDRFATNQKRIAHKNALFELLGGATRLWNGDRLVNELQAAGVPAGTVRTLRQVFADPSVSSRGMLVRVERDDFGAASVVNSPWLIDGRRAVNWRPPPMLGEHTDSVTVEWMQPTSVPQ